MSSPPVERYPVFDNHVHLDPLGLNLGAAQRFEKAGGTHFIVSHKPYSGLVVRSANDYITAFNKTLSLVENVNKNSGVTAFATVGPYPVELLDIQQETDLETAKDVLMKGMEIAQGFVMEGKAVAIGEVGRPHFPVDDDVLDASNEIMVYGMKLAKEAGCPIVLHTESAKEDDHVSGLLELGKKAGIKNEMIIKHFSPAKLADPELNLGLTPSIVARRKAVVKALKFPRNFLLETDYMDSLKRPDAVLPPEAVPQLLSQLLSQDLITIEDIFRLNQDTPNRLYGINIE